MHSLSVTLEGKLNVTMLCWISSSKCVKLRKESIRHLNKYSHRMAKKDYISAGKSIEKDLFNAKELKIPDDVLAWINLMADPFKYKYLLRYNVALLNPRAKMDYFLAKYEKLLQIQKLAFEPSQSRSQSKIKIQYEAVVNNIPLGGSDWWKLAAKNKYVKKVYVEKIANRSKSAFDLLMLVRDCIYHLMDHSVENHIVMFCADDKCLMIESCFRGIFHQFQSAMVAEGFEDVCHTDGQGM